MNENNEKLENLQPEVLTNPPEESENLNNVVPINNEVVQQTTESLENNTAEPLVGPNEASNNTLPSEVEVANIDVPSLPSEPINPVPTIDVEDNVIKDEPSVTNTTDNTQTNQETSSNNTQGDAPQQASPNNEEPKGKSQTKMNIVIIAAIIVLLFVSAFVFILPNITGNKKNNDKKEEKTETKDDDKEPPIEEEFNIKKASGAYAYDEEQIYLYIIDDNSAYISVYAEDEEGFSADLEIIDDKIVDDRFDPNIEIVEGSTKDSLKVTLHSIGESREYKKTGEYTKEDFFNSKYGNPENLKSPFSGVFKKDNTVIYLMQIDESTVRILSKDDHSLFDIEMDIQDGKLVGTLFDETYEIVYDKEGVVFTTTAGMKSTMDGNYKRESDLTMEIVIEEFD